MQMASHFATHARVNPRAGVHPHRKTKELLLLRLEATRQVKLIDRNRCRTVRSSRIRVSNGGDSYLDMWKNAIDGERKAMVFQSMVEKSPPADDDGIEIELDSPEVLERKSNEFQKILEVSPEERDRVQRMQVIDRAAAAIAAAKALLKESSLPGKAISGDSKTRGGGNLGEPQEGMRSRSSFVSQSGAVPIETPGPDFWSWIPPPDSYISSDDESNLKPIRETSIHPINTNPVMEKNRYVDILSIPLESKLIESNHTPPLPPLQSLVEVENQEISNHSPENPYLEEEHELGVLFQQNAVEAAYALDKVDEVSSQGVNEDGSRWWTETGIEQRPDGVICRWTLTRGVSADKDVEWEEKYWEAADRFNHKELGSEKSGRDAAGNVWHEFWKESMWQECGILHIEKTADKWGKNGNGGEWQEKWWEHYDASGKAEKGAHKWCSIDPHTLLDDGHAHVWHERWGEKYDGRGGSVKYTDKWAERFEGEGWAKWGDKWDEHFDMNGHGVKQGEKWWRGKYGDRWNRTWGEEHNGSGWVHKYGKSSSGEHWDTHEEQETWYERYPHYGFFHCFDNSIQLREVQRPSSDDVNPNEA